MNSDVAASAAAVADVSRYSLYCVCCFVAGKSQGAKGLHGSFCCLVQL